MALANGVLVHGPSAWAAAIRDADGEIRVASGRKRRLGPSVQTPFVRGPLRLAEALALLPDVRRRLPEARFPFERPAVAGVVVTSMVVASTARRSRLPLGAREAVVALASLAPALVQLRGGQVASYHGAEHVSIGTYEAGGERAAKEHERCGSHLVGPLLLSSAVAGAVSARAPARYRGAARLAGGLAAVGTAVEVFGWMTRHPRHPLARALARPGTELQRRLSTEEPSPDQLAVAEAALVECLAREGSPPPPASAGGPEAASGVA